MKKKIIPLLSVFLLIVLLLAAAPVLAASIPALPHAFFGDVLINGMPAPDGTLVSATVSDGTALQNLQNPVATVNGRYGGSSSLPLLVQGDIPNGATVTFHVTNNDGTGIAGTASFKSGDGPTRKNLSVNISRPPVTPTPQPPTVPSGPVVAPLPEVYSPTIRGFTSTVDLVVDNQGIAQVGTLLTSLDGNVNLYIAEGTLLLDIDGKPLKRFTLSTIPDPPAPPPAGTIVMAYDLGPDGAMFDPPITLSMPLPDGEDPATAVIAYWNGSAWEDLVTTYDAATGMLKAQISHFSIYGIIIVKEPVITPTEPAIIPTETPTTTPTEPAITPTETPTATPTEPALTPTESAEEEPSGFAWYWWVVIGVVAVALIAFGVILIHNRRD